MDGMQQFAHDSADSCRVSCRYPRGAESITIREVAYMDAFWSDVADPTVVSARPLGALYKMRWNIEVDFRAITATLEMDVLR